MTASFAIRNNPPFTGTWPVARCILISLRRRAASAASGPRSAFAPEKSALFLAKRSRIWVSSTGVQDQPPAAHEVADLSAVAVRGRRARSGWGPAWSAVDPQEG